MNSGDKVIQALARDVAEHITRKSIVALQGMADTLQDDDSSLTNVWDGICVQVQDEYSFFWDTYNEIARDFVTDNVGKLKGYEKEALWSQTEAGWDWHCDEGEREQPPVFDGDIVNYIVNKFLYYEAANWSNEKIREHLGDW